MQAKRTQFALRLLPSLGDFAFLMPIAFLFGRLDGVKTMLNDCDTGWHIRTGEWILANHAIPARDIFSYSRPGAPWFAWEWLSDVVMGWLNVHGGLQAVVLFMLTMLCVAFFLLFGLLRRKANPIFAVAITVLAAASSSIHWLARPHLFTLLFLVVFYRVLERVRQGEDRIWGIPCLAILPAVTALWTNFHGGFFVGILLILAYGGGDVLTMLFSPEAGTRPELWSKARRYFVCAAGCLAASLLNPYTYHLHEHILQYLRDPFAAEHIDEFRSLNFHHPSAIYFEVMIGLGLASACWHLTRKRYTEPLLVLVWLHGSLLAARNIPIYMIAASLPVAFALEEWMGLLPELQVSNWLREAGRKLIRVARDTTETDSVARWRVTSLAGVALVALVLYAPNPPKKFRAEFDPVRYPSGALKTLRSLSSPRIFANDEWGDYLIWSLYPNQKVFVDGRSDFYGNEFELKYLDVTYVKYDWEQTLSQYGVDTLLLSPGEPLAGVAKVSSHWSVVYDDGVALVFRSRTGVQQVSGVLKDSGSGRDREITKIQARDQAITEN